MDEFVREVDEEYRRDQAARLWKRWGALIVGVAALVIIGVGGWRYWNYLETTRAQQAAMRYYEALSQIDRGEARLGQETLEDIASSNSSGFAALARLRLAAELSTRDSTAAAQAFDAIAADSGVAALLRDLARLRAALLRLDFAPEEARASLQSLATPGNAFRHSAREALGLAALRAGDYEGAGRWFDQISADPRTPQALRARLEIYIALVAAGPLQNTQ